MASPDFLAFWALVALMVLSAGGAMASPARDLNVLAGAAIMLLSIAVIAAIQDHFASMASAAAFFWLDLVYAAAFYAIARPRLSDTPATLRSRDWASRVALILLYIVYFEMAHFAATRDHVLGATVAGIVYALAAIIVIGAWRARGLRGAVIALALFFATLYLAVASFVLFLNCLTAAAVAQITWRGGRASFENLRAFWLRRFGQAPAPPSYGAFARWFPPEP